MISSTINAQNGQGSLLCEKRAHVMSVSYHDAIVNAISNREVLCLEYQGNSRRIIPMVYGILKNGRKAVLCYKIVETPGQPSELYLRLYHIEKIRHLHGTSTRMEVNRKIDYYLTKHFGQVYQKI